MSEERQWEQEASEPENPYFHRRRIDILIDRRRHFQPWSTTPIPLQMSPKQMLTALGYPIPHGPHPVPAHCLYRGYRLEAKRAEPAKP